MPTVPVYGQAKVAPESVPGVSIGARVTPQALGSDIAKGVGDIASVQRDAFFREKQRQDQIATQDAENQAAQTQQALLYDPKTGALNTKMKDAFGIHDTTLKSFDDEVGKIESKLSNDTQRDAFRQAAAQRKLEITGALDRHVAQQALAFDNQTSEDRINITLAAITQKPDDWRGVEQDIGTIKRTIADHGKRNGLPDVTVQDKTNQAVTAARVSVIENLLASGKTEDAKTYFQTVGEDITGPARASITAKLGQGEKRDQSRGIADGITTSSPDLKSALDELEKQGVEDTATYDGAKNRIVNFYRLQKEADNAHQSNLLDDAHEIMNDPNNRDGILDPRMAAKLADMKPETREAVERYAAKKAEGVPIETNRFVYEDLYRMATNPATRDQFIHKTNLKERAADLSDADYKMFVKLQGDMAQDQGKGDDKTAKGIETIEQVKDDVLTAAKIDVSDKSEAGKARSIAFREQLNRAVIAWETDKKRKITPEEMRPLANRLVATQSWVEPRAGYNPVGWLLGDHERSGPAFSAPNVGQIASILEQVPAENRARIKASLERQGGIAKDDAIIALWNRRVLNPKKKASNGQ